MCVEVAVIGSGPAASAAAIHCRRFGMRTAIVAPPPRMGRSVLPETLPPAARPELESLGLWNAFQSACFPEHHGTVSAWGGPAIAERHSIYNPYGPGWYLDRRRFDDFLLRAASEANAVPTIQARLAGVARCRGLWSLSFDDGAAPLMAKVVVDATGRASAFARRIGVVRHRLDRQVCLSANCVPAGGAGREALIESAPGGWWFSAPTPAGELAAAYFTDADLLMREHRSPAGWHALLARSCTFTNTRIRSVIPGTLRVRLASSDYSQTCAGEGWFAVGDAATAFDPLASQGVLRALESARAGTSAICSGWNHRSDAIEEHQRYHGVMLERFRRERHYFYGLEQRWRNSPFWRRRTLGAGER